MKVAAIRKTPPSKPRQWPRAGKKRRRKGRNEKRRRGVEGVFQCPKEKTKIIT